MNIDWSSTVYPLAGRSENKTLRLFSNYMGMKTPLSYGVPRILGLPFQPLRIPPLRPNTHRGTGTLAVPRSLTASAVWLGFLVLWPTNRGDG